MTIADCNNLFDILYNNALSGKAPGLDIFDKSWFLTLSYYEIVKEKSVEFDHSEKIKGELAHLVKNTFVDYKVDLNATLNGLKINVNSKVFELTDDVWYIMQERLYTSETKSIGIKPIRLDEYNEQITNPFQKPNSKKAWRLDVADSREEPKKVVEIITTEVPTKYQVRYLIKPEPIVLGDLTTIDPDLDIDGRNTAQLPKISSEMIDEVIKRAVLLAVEAYKENSLQSKIAITNK